jgi:hypothetical protein
MKPAHPPRVRRLTCWECWFATELAGDGHGPRLPRSWEEELLRRESSTGRAPIIRLSPHSFANIPWCQQAVTGPARSQPDHGHAAHREAAHVLCSP